MKDNKMKDNKMKEKTKTADMTCLGKLPESEKIKIFLMAGFDGASLFLDNNGLMFVDRMWAIREGLFKRKDRE